MDIGRAPERAAPKLGGGRILSRVGVESWLNDPDANLPRGTVALPTSMKRSIMDDFSVREERDFHSLTVKARRMHLLD